MSHARLSPSGWDRWSTCPGSLLAQEGIPDSSSFYADEGTAAHWVFEQVLTIRYSAFFGVETASAQPYVGQAVNAASEGEEPRLITVGQDMADEIDRCLAFVAERVAFHREFGPTQVLAERKVNPEALLGTHECKGTADVTIISPWGVEVLDLKYGKGVVVDVHDGKMPNGQFMIYLAGVVSELDGVPENLCIGVLQPRAYHPSGQFRLFPLTPDDFHQFIDKAKEAVAATKADNPPRVASEKGCRFCRARSPRAPMPCSTWTAFVIEQTRLPANMDFNAVTAFATQNPADMEPDLLVQVLSTKDLLVGFLNAVSDWAVTALKEGTAPPALARAFKLEPGRSNRRWAFEGETLLQALKKFRWPGQEKATQGLKKSDYMEERIKSPAKVEEALRRYAKEGGLSATHFDAFNRLVEKPEGALRLVPASNLFNGVDDAPVPPIN